MTDLLALRSQEYSTNLELLSQQLTPKFATNCMTQSASGSKAFRMLSQVAETAALDITTSALPAPNVDVAQTGRWVYPEKKGWGTVVDDIELLQTNISPQGAYVQTALAAMNRKMDDMWLSAFFGDSKTGETGSTTTSFPAAQQVSVNEGGTASGLNVEKLRAAQELLLSNDIDLDYDMVYIGVSPKQHDDLLALTQVVSTDFNTRPVLGTDGKVRQFLGMNIIISNRLPTDGSSYRRLPVWVKSGMGCGLWKPLSGRIRNRSDLFGNPEYIEADFMAGFTRLEEDKCVEIKCAE